MNDRSWCYGFSDEDIEACNGSVVELKDGLYICERHLKKLAWMNWELFEKMLRSSGF
jgi:hypothetical protein